MGCSRADLEHGSYRRKLLLGLHLLGVHGVPSYVSHGASTPGSHVILWVQEESILSLNSMLSVSWVWLIMPIIH